MSGGLTGIEYETLPDRFIAAKGAPMAEVVYFWGRKTRQQAELTRGQGSTQYGVAKDLVWTEKSNAPVLVPIRTNLRVRRYQNQGLAVGRFCQWAYVKSTWT